LFRARIARLSEFYEDDGDVPAEVVAVAPGLASAFTDVNGDGLDDFLVAVRDRDVTDPEAYHLVYVPGYQRWVVTASQDGDDAWGCTDQAIGYFGGGGDRLARTGAVIRAYWQRRRSENESGPWCYLFDERLVSKRTAEQWRSRVWTRFELASLGL